MDSQNNNSTPSDKLENAKKRKKFNSLEVSDDSEGESISAAFNRFFVIEAVEGTSLAKYSPFTV